MRSSKRDLSTGLGGMLVLLSLLVSGCPTTPSPELDALTKAKLTKQLRDQATNCLEQFTQSGGLALDKLECYADKQRQTTIMHPSPATCPGCYFAYAQGLGLLGRYYFTTRQKAEELLETAPPEEQAELEATIQGATDKIAAYFRQSCDVYESYFSAGQGVDPKAFDNASQQYMELGEYGRAERCLKRLLQSTKLNASDEDIVKRRLRRCAVELEKQQRAKAREKLGLDPDQG